MKKIHIKKIEDLENLKRLEKGEYLVELDNDLDFYSVDSYRQCTSYKVTITNGFKPINFSNVNIIFNGNGYAIQNIYINSPGVNNIGLFNAQNNSVMVIKNLSASGKVLGNDNVGLLFGTFNGTINNCAVSDAIVTGNKSVGILVGNSNEVLMVNKTKISNSEVYAFENKGLVAGECNKVSLYEVDTEYADHEELIGSYEDLELRKKRKLKRVL